MAPNDHDGILKIDPQTPQDPSHSPEGPWALKLKRRFTQHLLSFHDSLSGDLPSIPLRRREILALLLGALAIVSYHYYGLPWYFTRHRLPEIPLDTPHRNLYPILYWGIASLFIRGLIPLAGLRLGSKTPLSELGLGLKLKSLRSLPWYLGLYLAVIPLLFFASSSEAFSKVYPLYRADLSSDHGLWVYAASCALDLFSLELLFRGLLLFGLHKRFGVHAIFIMLIPYTMMHYSRPFPEVMLQAGVGAALAGLALRSGTLYLGVLWQWIVALTFHAFLFMHR